VRLKTNNPLQRGNNCSNEKIGVGSFNWANFKIIVGDRGYKFLQTKGIVPLQGGDNSERVKIHGILKKKIFSRTSGPNSIKFGTNYPWMKGIQISSYKG
jgi:hypothetical protein